MGLINRFGRVTTQAAKDKLNQVLGREEDREEEEADEDAVLAAEAARDADRLRPRAAARPPVARPPAPAPSAPTPGGPAPTPGKRSL